MAKWVHKVPVLRMKVLCGTLVCSCLDVMNRKDSLNLASLAWPDMCFSQAVYYLSGAYYDCASLEIMIMCGCLII